jgi:diacylglycerol kinase family enzyme
MGLSSLTMRDTAREEKRTLGLLAYLWTGLQKLLGFQPIGFELTLDGEHTYRRADEVAIANNGALGMPAFRWGPEITLDDGTLDVCFVDARNLLDYLSILWHAFWGQQRQERRMHCLQAQQRVTVQADKDLPVQADGDIIGRQSVEVEIAPHSLKIIVPMQG